MKFLNLTFLLLLGTAVVNAATNQRRRYLREELSYDARKALSQAVLSAIRSPTGEVDPTAMEAAMGKGISRESILKAAEIAIQKTSSSGMTDPRSVQLKTDPSYKPAAEQGQESSFPNQMAGAEAESAIQKATDTGSMTTGTSAYSTTQQATGTSINGGQSDSTNGMPVNAGQSGSTSAYSTTQQATGTSINGGQSDSTNAEPIGTTSSSSIQKIQQAGGMSVNAGQSVSTNAEPIGTTPSSSIQKIQQAGGMSVNAGQSVLTNAEPSGTTSSSSIQQATGTSVNAGQSVSTNAEPSGTTPASSIQQSVDGDQSASTNPDFKLSGYSSSAIQQAAGMTKGGPSSKEQEAPESKVQAVNNEPSASGKKKRKFVEYQSSEWEMLWLGKVYDWGNKRQICDVLFKDQQEYVHLYLKMLCTSSLQAPHSNWCVIDDGDYQLWYDTENRQNFDLQWERPSSIPADFLISPAAAVTPSAEFERVASKMVFLDEQTKETIVEYIEPLVSHLRFPLSKCLPKPRNPEHKDLDAQFKGFLIPPPPVVHGDRAVLYDTGSASFKTDGLKYIFDIWQRHGISFDLVRTYDENTLPDAFWPTVPQEYIPSIQKMKVLLASLPEEALPSFPFLPATIQEETTENDYVVLKLDIDRSLVESRIIEFITNDPTTNIDEIIWEHHVTGNYLMYPDWPQSTTTELNLRQSYEYFLRLRKKGIRAHSWI